MKKNRYIKQKPKITWRDIVLFVLFILCLLIAGYFEDPEDFNLTGSQDQSYTQPHDPETDKIRIRY